MTTLRYFVKNYDCSMMLISCYAAAMVKLQSIITLICTRILLHTLTYATHGDILAGLDCDTRSLALGLKINITGNAYD